MKAKANLASFVRSPKEEKKIKLVSPPSSFIFNEEDVEDFIDLLHPILEENKYSKVQEQHFLYGLVQCLLFTIKRKHNNHIASICELIQKIVVKPKPC